ncbi:MAG: 3-oxoacyl-[acyl-carrier-protein] synthase / Chain length factor [Myxococcales bacterium]|nr:3-oxoacyl-[acyl-carrier-protein] synthase / Chain length factor [Myxococcales bacterium]
MIDAAGRRPHADAGGEHRDAGHDAAAQQRRGRATDAQRRHTGRDELRVFAGPPEHPGGDGAREAGDERDGRGACTHRHIFYHARVRFAVTALGVVSPLGVGEEAFFAALDAGTSAVATDGDGVRSARVGEFGAKQHIAPGSLRRLPRLSQMAIVAGKQALLAGAPPYDPTRTGVVLGTGLGTLEETIAFMRGYLDGGPEAASPLLFPSSVMNAAAGQLALECKLRGVNSTVNHRDASPLSALAMACDLLELGRADALVVGAVDELSKPALAGYQKLGAIAAGLVPGEGAAMMLVEREADARKRGANIRAWVNGRGESSDDRPRVGWGGAASWPEAARAVREAAGGRHIDHVVSGANGTRYDAREIAAVSDGLGATPPSVTPIAQIGESFSSGMQRLLCAVFLLERRGAERVLVPSFAQGGANVALVLERAG